MKKNKNTEEWVQPEKLVAHPKMLELAEKTKILLELESQMLGKFKQDLEKVQKENEKNEGMNNG